MTLTPESIAALLIALGAGPLLREIVVGVARWRSGQQDRERERVRRMITERDEAEELRRDAESDRDTWRECAIVLRFQMITAGLSPPDMPSE